MLDSAILNGPIREFKPTHGESSGIFRRKTDAAAKGAMAGKSEIKFIKKKES